MIRVPQGGQGVREVYPFSVINFIYNFIELCLFIISVKLVILDGRIDLFI